MSGGLSHPKYKKGHDKHEESSPWKTLVGARAQAWTHLHIQAHAHTHTLSSPLTWNSDTKMLGVLSHHPLLQLVEVGSQRPWNKGQVDSVSTEFQRKPDHLETQDVTYQ